ncbi:unnamed protein product [Prorocentrum cordatum]|uniref:Uncharacterized protein n=1 Tax=Prorocentrum cordatum TaxID=2364126 RepID=A0ABN9TPC1_9DINO|nr:unnamed protein product [Polarella glacialis]
MASKRATRPYQAPYSVFGHGGGQPPPPVFATAWVRGVPAVRAGTGRFPKDLRKKKISHMLKVMSSTAVLALQEVHGSEAELNHEIHLAHKTAACFASIPNRGTGQPGSAVRGRHGRICLALGVGWLQVLGVVPCASINRVPGHARGSRPRRRGAACAPHGADRRVRTPTRRGPVAMRGTAARAAGHRGDELRAWLDGLDRGAGKMLEYLEPLRLHFGSLAEIEACYVEPEGPDAEQDNRGMLQRVDGLLFEAIGAKTTGVKLMLARGVVELVERKGRREEEEPVNAEPSVTMAATEVRPRPKPGPQVKARPKPAQPGAKPKPPSAPPPAHLLAQRERGKGAGGGANFS